MTDPLRNPKNFLFKTWRTLALPDPTPLQYDFIEYLNDDLAWMQVVEEAGKEAARGTVDGARKILMAFRGAAKSYVTTTAGAHWLYINPLEEVLVVSATDNFAGNIATMAFQMITQFDWLAPVLAPSKDQRQSALAFDVRGARQASKDQSFTSRGIFGQITGLRATKIIGDDLETPNTSETETKRSQLRHRMSELGGAIIKPGGGVYLLGTAQHEQTVYKEYADEKGYELRIYPIRYPKTEKEESEHYGTRLAPMLVKDMQENPLLRGTSTEPSRFDERDILKRLQEWGNTEFQRQFLMWLDAGAGRLYPLKLRDLVAFDFTPPSPATGGKLTLPSHIVWSPLYQHRIRDLQVDSLPGDGWLYGPEKLDVFLEAEEVICEVDPSGEGDDETAWNILAGLGGRVYHCWGGASRDGHSETTMRAIAADCATWGVQLVKVESNFGQGMFSSLLKPHLERAGVTAEVEDVRVGKTMKEARIVDTMEPLTTSHRLVVNTAMFRRDFDIPYKDVEEAKRRFYRLSYQLTRIHKVRGAIKFDDRIDSLAGGCSHFAERLQRALDQEHRLSKDAAIAAEAEKIVAARIKAGLPVKGWFPGLGDEGLGFGRSKEGRKKT